jgi:hypothetical protein
MPSLSTEMPEKKGGLGRGWHSPNAPTAQGWIYFLLTFNLFQSYLIVYLARTIKDRLLCTYFFLYSNSFDNLPYRQTGLDAKLPYLDNPLLYWDSYSPLVFFVWGFFLFPFLDNFESKEISCLASNVVKRQHPIRSKVCDAFFPGSLTLTCPVGTGCDVNFHLVCVLFSFPFSLIS